MGREKELVEVWESSDGWHWHRLARNSRVTDASEEGKRNLSRLLRQLGERFPAAEVVVLPRAPKRKR